MRNAAFDRVVDGKRIGLFVLRNADGMECHITNLGGRIVGISVPDRHGAFDDVVLGFDAVDAYLNDNDTYFGAIIGRVANRTGGARFSLGSEEFHLTKNDGENHIHGGPGGFHSRVWEVLRASDTELLLGHTSPHGTDGYPGELTAKVHYILTEANALEMHYTAACDRPTPVNMTNHAYFNLNGAGRTHIEDHVLEIQADAFTPIGPGFLPTGEVCQVEGTPFDFRKPALLGDRFLAHHPQLEAGKGFDHNFVIDGQGLRFAARMVAQESGRVLELYTNQPGLQFYSGNFLNGKHKGKRAMPYPYRSAFCFESQHFPDSLNRPEFPSIILQPGETYKATCMYKFSVEGGIGGG